MMRLGKIIQKILPDRGAARSEEMAKLRLDFKERYVCFKQLISANNKALEMMSDIERALDGRRPFGMALVRSTAIGVSVNVLQMVKKIQQLAPGKYDTLIRRYDDIENKINGILNEKRPIQDKRLVIPLTDIDKDLFDLVGAKMANLGEVKNRIGLHVPPGFVITSAAYRRFVDHNRLGVEIDRQMQLTDPGNMENLHTLSARLHQLFAGSEIPPDLEKAVVDAWKDMIAAAGSGVMAAMRSSALGEDNEGSSFAGQYHSELNIGDDHLFEAYKAVVAGKYSPQAITYRLNKGFRDEDIAMCVGCLAMVEAVSGGVVYSRNPMDIHDESVFINAVWGLPKGVVDGSVNCDLFVMSRTAPIKTRHRDIKEKDVKFTASPYEGVHRIDLTQDTARSRPSINEAQAVSLAQLAIRIENHYGVPQDIEWAIDHKGDIYILQCRPLQQVESIPFEAPERFTPEREETLILRGGTTASPGAAGGQVYTVDTGLDILAFPEGAILVARDAHPRWASLLSRASGVIAERGGFAGHLATVAREFGVPALFGVSGAVNTLKTGDHVTLDATGRAIHKGCVADLLNESTRRECLMIGSGVHETLKRVSRYITPLNLLEPDDPGFAPENCATLHDMTRYIHEKAVHEMFHFGEERRFAERSSKQLYYKVPMQWWILDLDDGFIEAVDGKYIKLENIASIPMLAFWEGFTAVAWDGPPPLDGDGFMSVVSQPRIGSGLAPDVRSAFTDFNYVMISKNYCNLNSRIGYHLSTLEALISDRKAENFISFQFKGGAADADRRHRRVDFIKPIMEEYGFRVETKKDNLISRVDGHEKPYMLQRLKILGYLTLHTRQLDMIMTNSSKVDYYREKITQDIHTIITPSSGADNP